MAERWPDVLWRLIIIILAVVVIAGGIVLWSGYKPGQPVEISIPQANEPTGWIYIQGAVINPGLYDLRYSDTIDSLLKAAGGISPSADTYKLELYVPAGTTTNSSQKIDLNLAETWLLDALPGIGETLAQRIVDYRQINGPFRNTYDLLRVPGIGAGAYERIKDLIIVSSP